MALGVRESVSGRRLSLGDNGAELPVCGGKGVVYRSGPKVALRCCGKASLVVTRRLKQRVLRLGDVLLLDQGCVRLSSICSFLSLDGRRGRQDSCRGAARDTFYANGTLTKYEVIDLDAARQQAPALAGGLNVLPTRVPSITLSSAASSRPGSGGADASGAKEASARVVSSYFAPRSAPSASASAKTQSSPSRAAAATSSVKREASTASTSSPARPRDAKKTGSRPAASRIVVEVDSEEEEEDDARAPVRIRRNKSARAIIESDEEEDDDDEPDDKRKSTGTTTAEEDQDMADDSPDEDDVFMRELQVGEKSEAGSALGSRPRVSAARDWIEAYGRIGGASKKLKTDSSSSTNVWTTAKRGSRKIVGDDGDDDGDSDEQFTRSHDEVGQLLVECEQIAKKLRRSILDWSGNSQAAAAAPSSSSSNSTDVSDEDRQQPLQEEHVSLSEIATMAATSNGRRVVTQDDIPGLCDTLVLKPYQVVGVNWLLLLNENNVSSVLADEMGLGKTVQTIAFLQLLEVLAKKKAKNVKTAGPHLVVVPASVLNNWKREFKWIAPTLRVVVYHGAKNDRLELQDTLLRGDREAEDGQSSFDVLLTTYSYFERDSCQEDRAFLRGFKFGYMILDEGHSIKNAKTSRFKRITAMRARTRLVLSGTPIQNNLNELLALLSFLMPRMFDHGSDELLSFFDGNEESKCAKVRRILAPFILRREKKYVLNQLVPKMVHVEMLDIGEKQRKAYRDLLETVIKQKEAAVARKQEAKDRKRRNKSKLDRQVRELLGDAFDVEGDVNAVPDLGSGSDAAIFTQLRKAANHPALLRLHYMSDEVLDTMTRCLHRADAFGNQCSLAMVRKELESYSDFELHDLCVQYAGNDELRALQLPHEALLASSKFDYLRELLPKLRAEGHRVLIFSQWTKLLDLLEVLMGHMDYRYLRLDGSTDVAERQGLIDTYNADTSLFCFLLSTRAGGLGINLTAADTVILHDLDFNPTNDEQACDRCHRIGQTRSVSIYKLVATDTVDHEIYKLGETKTQLNHAVLGKLNAHGDEEDDGEHVATAGGRPKRKKKGGGVTVEMMLSSVISTYKQQTSGSADRIGA
jgi:SWI/SNF-related matrix-associated actin-dependent regulator 1 of chromatin subfamily A